KQERHFEVEDDEENRDQIEADVELHARVVERIEAAFIGGELFSVRLLERNKEWGNQQRQVDQARHADKHHKGKIMLKDARHRHYLCPRFRKSPQIRRFGMVLEA